MWASILLNSANLFLFLLIFQDLILKKESGCVLAHSMGLGKTLQTIALIHTLHYCDHALSIAPSRTYLLLAPASVVHNWKAEFELWLDKNTSIPAPKRNIPVYLFGDTDEGRGNNIETKRNLLEQWRSTGGVFILSFESYRTLLSNKKVLFTPLAPPSLAPLPSPRSPSSRLAPPPLVDSSLIQE